MIYGFLTPRHYLHMKLWLLGLLLALLLLPMGFAEAPLINTLCIGVTEGEACNMPALFEGEINGICCSNECVPGVSSCEEETDKGEDFFSDAILDYSCRGNEDATRCRIPDYLLEASGLSPYGICCNELCVFKEQCPSKPDDPKDVMTVGRQLPDLLIVAIVIAICAVLLLLVWYVNRRKKPEAPDKNSELQNLYNEKTGLENMIRMAKKKYHGREIDEESFREIVRDKEKRLIEVETRIEEINQTVSGQ